MIKRRRFLIAIVLVAFLVPLIWLIYFFVGNEAPITNGQVIYNQEFKPGLSLDIYLPNHPVYKKMPVVLFIHGGAWIAGTKEAININRFNGAVKTLRNEGYCLVAINYTLAKKGQSPFPECIIDAVDAVNWLREKSDTFHFDMDNIGLFGESAGAHIGMMVGYANPQEYAETYSPVQFRYIVDVYGPNRLEGIYNMAIMDSVNAMIEELPESFHSSLDIASYLFGFDPRLDSVRAAEIMQKYSPYNYVNAKSPPTLLIHGDEDQIVPIDQSLVLAEKLSSVQVTHELHILENVDHGFIFATDTQMAQVQTWITRFITSQYKKE